MGDPAKKQLSAPADALITGLICCLISEFLSKEYGFSKGMAYICPLILFMWDIL